MDGLLTGLKSHVSSRQLSRQVKVCTDLRQLENRQKCQLMLLVMRK